MRRLLPALALLALAAPANAGDAPGPADVVKQIYHIAAGPKGDYQSCDVGDGAACGLDGPRIHALLTRSLAALLDDMNKRSEAANSPILDFDPISDSQDPSIDRLSIVAAPPKGDEARVAVSFYFEKGAKAPHTALGYLMKREDGAWRVDDIVKDGKDGWDLRKIAASVP
jgi:Protein of unknown function (DUF3828)